MIYINNNKINGFGGIKRAYLNNTLIFQAFKKNEEVISPYDITSTFNVTSTTSPIKLCESSATSAFTEMYVDGIQIDVSSGYTFNTLGEHTVQYKLNDKENLTDNAFNGCSSLTSIEIPSSVTSIGSYAFYYCTSLTSVTIPSSVTSIDDYAFWNCSSLTSIELPSSLTSISWGTFRACSSLTSVTIPNSVTSIGYESFRGCSSLTSVEIPNSVTSIASFAFYNCKSLTSIEIPSSLTSISDYAFKDCSSLTEITCNSTSAPTIGTDVFNGVPSSGTLIYPCESDYSTWLTQLAWEDTCNTTKYDITSTFNVTSTTSPTKVCYITSAFTEMYIDGVQIDVSSGYTFNTTGEHTVGYTLSDKTTTVKYLFDRCIDLTSVKIIDSVTNIGQGSFYGCSGLTSITIPDNVTIIGESAFNGCIMLESITIPSSLTTIGAGAFQQCSSLTSITIPSSVTSIGDSIFVNCYFESDKFINNSSVSGYPWSANICDVIQEDGLCISGTTAIKCRPKATNVVIPSSVTSIKNNAFYNCKRLISVDIGNGVTTIGTGVFRNCTSLKNVIFGSGVTSIGSNFGFGSKGIFDGCTSLTEITCLAQTAPTLLTTSIQGVENNGGTLYVPQGSDYSTWTAILTSWTIQYIT